MPYSDNGAVDTVLTGLPKPGPTPPVNLMPYNRLVVVIGPEDCSGTIAFQGSIDGANWYELGLKDVITQQTVSKPDLGTFSSPRAYSLYLQDSATAHFRVLLTGNVSGTNLTITSRKENT